MVKKNYYQQNCCQCTSFIESDRGKRKSLKYNNAENPYTEKHHTDIFYNSNYFLSSKQNVTYPILSKSQRRKKSSTKISIINKDDKLLKKRLEKKDKNMYSQTQQETKATPLTNQYGNGDPGNTNAQCLTKHTYKLPTKVKNTKEKHLCKCKIFKKVRKDSKRENYNADHLNNDMKHKQKKTKSNIPRYTKRDTPYLIDHTQNKTIICKCGLDNENSIQTASVVEQTGEPFFELKVDKRNMHVLNATEVKNNVKTLGIVRSRYSCICPSHRKVCEKGACEKAKKNKQTNFNCKCKNNIKECSDQTCSSNRLLSKRLFFSSPKVSAPLFEVSLDPSNMSIVNTAEIKDIFDKSKYGVCPTGVCSNKGRHNNKVNCSCINKKIIRKPMECTEKSCNPSKCNLYYICSKVFSGYKTWDTRDKYFPKRYMQARPSKEINNNVDTLNRNSIVTREVNLKKYKKEKQKKNGLNINFSRNRSEKHSDVRLKPRKDISTKTNKMKNKRNEKHGRKKKKVSKCCSLSKKLNQRNTKSLYTTKVVQCFKWKQKRCKQKIKEHEKSIVAAEKKADKENRVTRRNIDKLWKQEDAQWNCLTKFLSGIMNLVVETVKTVISALFTLIFSPIKSLLYIKRRVKDLNGSLTRLCNWVRKVWGNRSNKISRKVKNIAALNVIADELQESAFYEVFADKGRTKEEKARYEANKRKRKRRIEKRDNEARFGCRHILLTTLRKTPCLCCYYLSPNLYPACLGLIGFIKNFFNVIVYLLAFICWTPCILSFEICRACVCCFFCTG